jgi:predicted DNA-binding protein with PD1-like motif
MSGSKFFALRLKPGQDLFREIQNFVTQQKIGAGYIATCVGSLSQAQMRFAGAKVGKISTGPFEITSLVGTVSVNGMHLHISLANASGEAMGGHLMPLSLIHTTAEIVIGDLEEVTFTRVPDPQTGFKELEIKK